jgi:DNA-directed RNA polymerase
MAFLLELFKWLRLHLGNLFQFASFCNQGATMTSQRSEIKLGAEKPLKLEEVK